MLATRLRATSLHGVGASKIACKFVEDHITPNGWCQLFVKKT
jgi:hypothetical protein